MHAHDSSVLTVAHAGIQPPLDELGDILAMHRDEVSSLESLWICAFWVIQPSGRGVIPNSKVLVSECACCPTIVECETTRIEDLDDRRE